MPLSDINILIHSRPEVAINNTTDRNRLIENDEEILQSLDNEVVVSKDRDYIIADPSRLTEYTKQVIIYIAGFVVRKLEIQLKCAECLSTLRSPDKLENTFLIRKDKGRICHPSKHVIKLCKIAEEVYRKNKMLKKGSPTPSLAGTYEKMCRAQTIFG